MRPIDVGEWRWVSGLAAVLLVLVAVPYAIALLHPPEGYLLARTLYYGNDLSQYLAAMGDGIASSSWLVHDHLTSEPHSPALMYTLYVVMGKVAGLLGLPVIPLFAVVVAVSTAALTFAAYSFSAAFLNRVRDRRTALILVLFGSGIGIWIAAAGVADPSAGDTGRGFAFHRAELSTYLLPFGPPHLTLGLALLLVWGRALAEWCWTGSTRTLLWLLLSTLGVGLVNSFSMASLVAVSSSYALVRWLQTARFPLREVAASVLVGVVSAPLLVNSLLTFALNPFWGRTYGQQNMTPSASPWVLAADLGVLLPLAVAGVIASKGRRESKLLLSVWFVTLAVAMYLPVSFQRRFGFGLQPALAVLAALGMGWLDSLVLARIALVRWRPLLMAVVSTLAVSGAALGYTLVVMASLGIGGLGQAVFEPAPNVEAASWLADHSTPEDVVLASVDTGNFLAGQIPGRVVAGHGAGTLDAERKQELVSSFFDPSATPTDRWRIAAESGATHIFLGPRERALGGEPLPPKQGFQLVYDKGGVQIYRVGCLATRGSIPAVPSSLPTGGDGWVPSLGHQRHCTTRMIIKAKQYGAISQRGEPSGQMANPSR